MCSWTTKTTNPLSFGIWKSVKPYPRAPRLGLDLLSHPLINLIRRISRGETKRAEGEVVEKMVKTNGRTCGIVVGGYCREGRLRDGLRFVRKMKEMRVEAKEDVWVIIRTRPLSSSEISTQGNNKCVRQDNGQAITWIGNPEARFTFDLVADENVTQEKMFKVAGVPMVENVVAGYNSCMFAYGHKGSGKTHTMLGDIEGGTRRHSVNCGMTPRVFEYMFSRIQKEKEVRKEEKLQFTCRCSFLEIYNEQILDLLDPTSFNLQLREDHKKGIHVENLKEIEVSSARLEDSLPDSPFASAAHHLHMFAESKDNNELDLWSPSSDNDDNSTPSTLSDSFNSFNCQIPRLPAIGMLSGRGGPACRVGI